MESGIEFSFAPRPEDFYMKKLAISFLPVLTLAMALSGCGSNTSNNNNNNNNNNGTPAPTATAAPSPTPGSSAAVNRGPGLPTRVFAPYVDATLGFSIVDAANATGQKYYVLGFIVDGGGCKPRWGASYTLDYNLYVDQINAIRAGGGDVVVALGGFNGTELAQACSTVASLQGAYQQLVDYYKLTWLDFDIENGPSGALADSTSNSRRNQALAGLQLANPGLRISYTLPVATTGLTAGSTALLQDAKNKGVNVGIVNALAMDYGGAQTGMGTIANAVASSVKSQIAAVGLNSKIGVTIMIGQNDVAGETFTQADGDTFFASSLGNSSVTFISFWSAGRDNGGCAGTAAAQSNCSGIAQSTFEFTNKFKGFN
jgi:hypothetical protein